MTGADPLDVVLGTGALGRAVAEELLRRGRRVRLVNHSGRLAAPPAGADLAAADLTDADAAQAACAGAETAYLCANVPYTDWPAKWPPLAAGILEGAARAGAKLVYGDNLYSYGFVAGPLREDLPAAAANVKGRVRARIAADSSRRTARGGCAWRSGVRPISTGPGRPTRACSARAWSPPRSPAGRAR